MGSARRQRRPAIGRLGWVGRVALLLALLAGAGPRFAPAVGMAQACAAEQEPNDAPEQAQAVAGAVCMAGTLGGSDQDIFLWTVAQTDATKTWSLTVQGVPQTVTSLKVFRVTSAPGETPLVLSDQLFEVDSAP